MKYVLAISGGVDSMVLLDMMMKKGEHDIVVAHFDHGIRDDSREDLVLISYVCKKHGLTLETAREELGSGASEALARDRRYRFLHQIAEKYHAKLVTAHHLDDLVETVAINFMRGTGWRGLAVFESEVERPLLAMEKAEIIAYARQNSVKWREDSTNESDAYMRNRVRLKTSGLTSDKKRELLGLYQHQKLLRREIEQEAERLVGTGPAFDRYFFTHVSTSVALECLRQATAGRLTRPQLVRLLHAVKTAKTNTQFTAGNGIEVHFTTRQFSL